MGTGGGGGGGGGGGEASLRQPNIAHSTRGKGIGDYNWNDELRSTSSWRERRNR